MAQEVRQHGTIAASACSETCSRILSDLQSHEAVQLRERGDCLDLTRKSRRAALTGLKRCHGIGRCIRRFPLKSNQSRAYAYTAASQTWADREKNCESSGRIAAEIVNPMRVNRQEEQAANLKLLEHHYDDTNKE